MIAGVDRAQTLVFEQHFDVAEAGDTLAEDVVNRGLVQELLRRMPAAAGRHGGFDERHPVGVDPSQGPVGQHVLLQPVGQPDGLPDAHDLLVGRDGPRPPVHVGVALDDDDVKAQAAKQIGGGGARRPVADHRHVVGRILGHCCLAFVSGLHL